MSDLKLIGRIAALHLAGPVVQLAPRGPKVPGILIAGRKYALSTDGGPLGDVDEESDEGMLGGGRIIRGPVDENTKWKYLWVYDTDRQRVTMWRAADGNEKVHDTASSQQARIVRLERKGQLNRVTHEEFIKVERAMQRAAAEQLEALKRYLKENESAFQGAVDAALKDLMNDLRPKMEAQLVPIAKGAVPFGWKPPAVEHQQYVERSKITFVMSRFFEREFSLEKCEAYLLSKGLDVNAPGHDSQAAQWARNDIMDAEYDRQLPDRPEG